MKDIGLEKLPSEGVFAPRWGRGRVKPLTQKLYISRIFLFQGKILNFAIIGFHLVSLSTFIRYFALHCNVKKFERFE